MAILDIFLIAFVLIVAFGSAWFFYMMMEREDDGYDERLPEDYNEEEKGDK